MSARLPPNSNLNQLKKQARELLRTYQSGDSEIIDRVLAVYTPKAKDLVGNVLWTSSWNLAQISMRLMKSIVLRPGAGQLEKDRKIWFKAAKEGDLEHRTP